MDASSHSTLCLGKKLSHTGVSHQGRTKGKLQVNLNEVLELGSADAQSLNRVTKTKCSMTNERMVDEDKVIEDNSNN